MSKLINDEVRSEYTFPHLYSQAYIDEKDKEIDRLNNIIDELEKYFTKPNKFIVRPERMKILDKLKELKEEGNK